MRKGEGIKPQSDGVGGEGVGFVVTNCTRSAVWPVAIAAARFLALTGWRSREALGLRWKEIDLGRRTAMLGETKTGRSASLQCYCRLWISEAATSSHGTLIACWAIIGQVRSTFGKDEC